MSDSGSSRAASPAPDGLQQPDSAALPPGDEQPADDSLETSFFPAPAPYYTRYTSDNLSLPLTASIQLPTGQEISRAELEPPNIDWIVEEGNYSVFGETWPIEEKLPTLAEMGVRELFDPTVDRSSSLLNLLRTLLLTYTQLLTSLLSPPPSLTSVPPGAPEPPTDPERLVEHTRLIGVNMHHLVNELRPVQARETLKTMMRAQIDQRRAKTVAIKQKCGELQSTLAGLKADLTHSATTAEAMEGQRGQKIGGRSKDREELARDKLRALVDGLE